MKNTQPTKNGTKRLGQYIKKKIGDKKRAKEEGSPYIEQEQPLSFLLSQPSFPHASDPASASNFQSEHSQGQEYEALRGKRRHL